MKKRRCKKCGLELEISNFGKHVRKRDGIDTHCKSCKKVARAKWIANINPDEISLKKRISDQDWYKRNKEKKLETNKKWKQQNKKHTNEWYADYVRKRKKNDPTFKLMTNLRTRIWYALKKNQKQNKTIELLGCTAEFLKNYLESLWKPGMTWENWSIHGWHIDHIKPLTAFDLSDPEQLKIACHYTNLQPLWAKDNIQKGGKLF